MVSSMPTPNSYDKNLVGQFEDLKDTHVGRISKRLGLTENKDPVKIEFDLMEIIPQKEWNDFSLRLIFFGRAVCKARKPACPTCPLYDLCDYPDKDTT